jgi:hypothetical protein
MAVEARERERERERERSAHRRLLVVLGDMVVLSEWLTLVCQG